MAVSIFFDKYKDQAAGLEAIRGDAQNIQQVLEDEQKFRYKFPSEDPTLFETHQFENQGRLVSTFKMFLAEWVKRQPKGTVVDTFLLYVHGHGHTSYLSLFLHNHNLRPENFTLESA